MFQLSDLLAHKDIVIQCHNIPDADTLASAFAVCTYLQSQGVKAKMIYSGPLEITKPNLLEMILELAIPIEYVARADDYPPIATLVLADCQYGERNVEKFLADTIIVIDHHAEVKKTYTYGIIRSNLGSCSTLIWDLLQNEHFNFSQYPHVATALYYGLYTDTNNLEEISHPLDKDARDSLKFNQNTIKKLRNNNLTLGELNIAGAALMHGNADHDLSYAIFKAEPCDPNILGFISDLALQVNGINLCVVYNTLRDGFKLSVRSCTREVMANEFTQYLTEGVGSGGGHLSKAGGFIQKTKIEELNINIEEYVIKRTQSYFNTYDVVDSARHHLDISHMSQYKKRNIQVGYVLSTDIFEAGTPMLIRTLEGDAEAEAAHDIYLMIGLLGEVYPIKAEKFNSSYLPVNESINEDFYYSPTVKNKITGESVAIIKLAKSCMAMGEVYIYAMALLKNTKVFTSWNTEGYMFGTIGDFIAVRADDLNDVYIIRADIFEKTYVREPANEI